VSWSDLVVAGCICTLMKKFISPYLLVVMAICCSVLLTPAYSGTPDTASINEILNKSREYIPIDTDSALLLAKEGLGLAVQINYRPGIAKGNGAAAVAEMNLGNYDAAFTHFNVAEKKNQLMI